MRFVRSLFARRPRQTYRDLPAWLHLALLAFYGLVNLHLGSTIVPELVNTMKKLDEMGVAAFFAGASLMQVFLIVVIGVPLYGFAIFCLIGSLASLDVLKNRLLGSSSKRTSGPKQENNQLQLQS